MPVDLKAHLLIAENRRGVEADRQVRGLRAALVGPRGGEQGAGGPGASGVDSMLGRREYRGVATHIPRLLSN